jgi:predicted Zn-dependent protease
MFEEFYTGPMDELDLGGFDANFLSVYRQSENKTKILYSTSAVGAGMPVFDEPDVTTQSATTGKIFAGRGTSENYQTLYGHDASTVEKGINSAIGRLTGDKDDAFFDNIYARGPAIGTVYRAAEFEKDPHQYQTQVKDYMKQIADEIKAANPDIKTVKVQYTLTETTDDYQDNLNNHLCEERMLGHLAVQIELTKKVTDEEGNEVETVVTGFDSIGTTSGAELVLDGLKGTAYSALNKARIQYNAHKMPVKDGEKVRVMFGGKVTGVFIHEMVGHMAEADAVLEGGRLGQKYGEVIAPDFVTIKEIAQFPGGHGNIYYDNEMMKANDLTIMENGAVTGFMTDRHTAVELANRMGIDMGVTGNGRSQDGSYDPMPRMRNTILENGENTHEELLAQLGTGLYIVGSSGGYVYTSTGQFAVKASEAYWVENGEIQYAVDAAAVSGYSLDVLGKIEALGDDATEDNFVGFCGKGGWWSAQWAPVSGVGPEVLVSEMSVGEGGFARSDLSRISEDKIDRPFEFESFGRSGETFGRHIVTDNGVLWW